MGRGLTFRIADIPVRIDPSFLLIVALFGLSALSFEVGGFGLVVAWVIVATVSVLIHELGHAFAFRAYGNDSTIALYGFGGVTTGERLPPGKSIVVSLAGPLTGLIILGVPSLILQRSGVVQEQFWELVLLFVVWVNVFWSFVNLLPILPLDGGNVTQSLIHLATGKDARRITQIVSLVIAGAAGIAALAYGFIFGVLFAGIFVWFNIAALSKERNDSSVAQLREAQVALSQRRTHDAIDIARDVQASRSPMIKAAAVETQAWGWLFDGNVANARDVLQQLPNGREPGPLLKGSFSLLEGRADEGLTLIAYGFASEADGPGKFAAALLAAQGGHAMSLARDLLDMEDGKGVGPAATLAALYHHAGRFTDGAAVGSMVYDDGRAPRATAAYNVACSLARANEPDSAIGWLRAAVDCGFSDINKFATDPDLSLLRSKPEFAGLRQRVAGAVSPRRVLD